MNQQRKPGHAPELVASLKRYRGTLIGAGVFSGFINMLALTSSIYMLQVYDRVIPSHSTATLIGLSAIMLVLFAAYGVLDIVRTRLLARVGAGIENDLRDRVIGAVLELPFRSKAQGDGMQPIRDLDQIRGFMAGAGPVALFDLPWLPFYLALVWLLHPWLGILALAGAIVLVGLTLLTEMRSRKLSSDLVQSSARRQVFADASRRNAEAVRALGMSRHVTGIWSRHSSKYLGDHIAATDVVSTYGAISKVMRLVLQSAVLGLGAYLVIIGQGTAGVMIAASILVSRALAPIEIAIGNWRGFVSARQSMTRLSTLLSAIPERKQTLDLPRPASTLYVEGLFVAPPGDTRPIVHNVSFNLEKGAGLGIIGPSASGKSTLARALIGAWSPMRGAVRLDGASLDQWAPDTLGQHIGYLPQDIELFDGTVAQNIARLRPDATAEQVVEAARQACAHDMILRLPNGYETEIGEGGTALSAGQRQRVALARALFGNPFLVVLDEPNSNLDSEGDIALTSAILSVRARGGIVIVIAHRPSAMNGVDKVLVLAAGTNQMMGAKDEILPKVMPQPPKPAQPAAARAASAQPGQSPHAPPQARPSDPVPADARPALPAPPKSEPTQSGPTRPPEPPRTPPSGDGTMRLKIITDGNSD